MSNLLDYGRRSSAVFAALVLIAWGLAIIVSLRDAYPAFRASYAILQKDTFWNTAETAEESLTKQRQIQSHYLSYGVYIPLDDIVIGAHVSNTQALKKSIEGVCGPGSTAIWVPVAFHFPIFGEKVFEWCLVRT
ncbi:MAG: hypothetical protein H7249_18560 [Chitinophagaceae bacterium]|nr:hypothetical protein [Oligoflexus sp.]